MGPPLVRHERVRGVSVLHIDDSKVNALGFDLIEQLDAGLTQAADCADVIVVVGRPGVFSAGFDLEVMRGGGADRRRLVRAGFEVMLRIVSHDCPVIAACTGHAIAAGALLLLSCDLRFGEDGPYNVGLNETAMGIGLPPFAAELLFQRLPRRAVDEVILGDLYSPRVAMDLGYTHSCERPGDVVTRALDAAARLASNDPAGFRRTKQALRAAEVGALRNLLPGERG